MTRHLLLLVLSLSICQVASGDEVVAGGSGHWSFQPISRPPVPAFEDDFAKAWVTNEIDAFVLAELRRRDLDPSDQASRETLLRRASLDLRGLPPSIDELDRVELDPGALEPILDEMLASTAHAERWTRHWLDLARYADSDGYEKDTVRPNAWRWRDWVLEAIARDLPYDQFLIEQLAGDLLPNADDAQRAATGFHRNTLTNKEGGADEEEFRVAAVKDRVDTTFATLLGLTMACAQCHDHKYDPLTQREYYQALDFFNHDEEVEVPATPTAREVTDFEEANRHHQRTRLRLERELAPWRPIAQSKIEQLRQEWRSSPVVWSIPTPEQTTSSAGATFSRAIDHVLEVGGERPDRDTYEVQLALPAGATVSALRLAALAGAARRPGRTDHGNFVVTELSLAIADRDGVHASPVAIASVHADFAQRGFDPSGVLDDDPRSGWAVSPRHQEDHHLVAILTKPLRLSEPARLRVTIRQDYGDAHTLRRFRIGVTDAHAELVVVPPDVGALLSKAEEDLREADRERLTDYGLELDPGSAALLTALQGEQGDPPVAPRPRSPALARRAQRRTTHVHTRGDFLRPAEAVHADTPAILPPLAGRGAAPDRLDLALWICDPRNPLTARVAVNRVWTHLFGRGLVATPDDFGTRGERPSHPALLDWLAATFVDVDGWSRRRLIRRILASRTWRQASVHEDALQARDPLNAWLARQSRFRVEAEVVRDLHLAVSGLLSTTVGGPPVRPPLPADVAKLGYADSVRWEPSTGDDRYRRGLYIMAQRTVPYPMLQTFDGPDTSTFCIRRERSNTPLQALTTLNDPVFFECSRALGARLHAYGGPHDPLVQAFRVCLARAPSELERSILRDYHRAERERCRADIAATAALCDGHGEDPDLAAWISTARVLTNLDEFVTRE